MNICFINRLGETEIIVRDAETLPLEDITIKIDKYLQREYLVHDEELFVTDDIQLEEDKSSNEAQTDRNTDSVMKQLGYTDEYGNYEAY